MEVLLNPASMPFLVALYVLVGLVALELLLLVLGADAFHFIDDYLPDIGENDAPETLSFAKALSFIGIGKVPVIVVLMSFLALFGLGGFLIQNITYGVLGAFLPLSVAVPTAIVAALASTRQVARAVARFLPSEETTAVSETTLFGRIAVISFGDATHTMPATARVVDSHGKTHHIQLKASSPEELFVKDQQTLIVSKSNGFYIGTHVPIIID